jgi:hypothetical protein
MATVDATHRQHHAWRAQVHLGTGFIVARQRAD